jgi:hypothetical protein
VLLLAASCLESKTDCVCDAVSAERGLLVEGIGDPRSTGPASAILFSQRIVE